MRKIGLRLLILAVLWVAFTQLLPRRVYLGPEYTRWEAVFDKIEELKASKQSVNLVMGDSRPEMGIASKHLRAMNLGLGGTSPVEGYYEMMQLEGVPIDTLYLSYSPSHFHAQDCFHTRAEYFDLIDPAFLEEVMTLSRSTGDTAFDWNNWVWLDDLDKNFPSPWVQRQLRYLPAIKGFENYRWFFKDRPISQADMQAEQMSYLFPSDICPGDTSVQEYYLEKRAGGFFPNAVNVHYFSKLMQEVQRRNIHLIWINMPLNKAIRQPSQRYYADFESWMLQQLPPGTNYLPLAFQDSCDFKDFSHLDKDAANTFGQKIEAWVKAGAQALPE